MPPAQSAPGRDILREAGAAYQSGDMATAIKLYREFLKEYSEAAEIRSNLAAALVRSGEFDEAIKEYKLALEKLPNNPRVRMNLALAFYKVGRIPDAMQELQVLLASQPLEVEPALLLADCLLQSGRAENAVETLRPLEQEYPDNRAVTYMLGVSLLRQNQTERAKALLDRILRNGESAESAYLLGQSAYLSQDNMAAVKYLARAVELNPKLPGVHSLYGIVLKTIGKPDEATSQFQEELKTNAYDYMANIEIGMLSKQERKLDEALLHIERALQVRPADPGARYQRASIHSMQGKIAGAQKEFEQLVRDYPDFAEAHAALATVYYRLKRKEDGDRERAAALRAQQAAQKRLEQQRTNIPQPPKS